MMVNPMCLWRQCAPLPALVLGASWAASRRPALLGLSGTAAGTAVLVSQETGLFAVAALAAMILVVLLSDWSSRGDAPDAIAVRRPATGLSLFLFALGALLTLGSWCAIAAARGSLALYLRDTLGGTLGMVGAAQHHPLPALSVWLRSTPEPSWGERAWFVMTYAPWTIFLFAGGPAWRRWRRCGDAAGLLLWVFAVLCWTVNLGRGDRFHAAYAAGPAVMLGLVALAPRQRVSLDPACARAAWTLGTRLGAGAIVLSLAFMGASTLDSVHWLHDIRTGREPGYSADVPFSGGARILAAQCARIQGLLAAVETHCGSREPIFAMPHDPMIYFFSQRENPTRFACAIFAGSERERAEIVSDLERRPPGCFLLDQGGRIESIDYDHYLEPIIPLLRDYRKLARVGETEVWAHARLQPRGVESP
jgi:hypothetical protein